jgi:predicted metal-binding membrane protein
MGDMPMPGGATMSIAMSVLMMVAMMLPSSALMLRRDRQVATQRGEHHLLRRAAIVGAGYLVVWLAIGAAIALLGDGRAHLGPLATVATVIVAGAFQFTSWKARRLECLERQLAATGAPFRHGLRLGIRCVQSCANLMAILLVLGAMNVLVMVAVTIAVTAERALRASASRRVCDRPADVTACVSA